jgi:rubrerythrin
MSNGDLPCEFFRIERSLKIGGFIRQKNHPLVGSVNIKRENTINRVEMEELDLHTKIHTKETSCDMCDKLFTSANSLVAHTSIHNGDRPYKCPICNKRFRQKGTLKDHARTHTTEKPFICSFCNKAFGQRSILHKHVRIHTGDHHLTCEICGYEFVGEHVSD